MLMRHDAVVDSFNYAKENMGGAYSFLDRFEGLALSIKEAKRRYPSRKLVLEFGVYKSGMINYQARRFPGLGFGGFDSLEGLQQQRSGMAPEKAFDLGGKLPRVRRNARLVKGWFAGTSQHVQVPLQRELNAIGFSCCVDQGRTRWLTIYFTLASTAGSAVCIAFAFRRWMVATSSE